MYAMKNICRTLIAKDNQEANVLPDDLTEHTYLTILSDEDDRKVEKDTMNENCKTEGSERGRKVEEDTMNEN